MSEASKASEASPKNKGGRPYTGGETPKRQVRMGDEWLRAEVLARVSDVKTAVYIQAALREYNRKTASRLGIDPGYLATEVIYLKTKASN